MCRASWSIFPAGLVFLSMCVYGQTGDACDLNQDGVVDSTDVHTAVNMSLGLAPCTASIAGADVCNVVVVQRVINAVSGGTCLTSTGLHIVKLSWTGSSSSGVNKYNVYRGTASGGPYTLLSSLGNVTCYSDTTALPGQTYYYAVTAVDSGGNESGYSAQSTAVIPIP